MKYQLVLQWSAASIDDYDAVIEIEDFLISHLPGESEVDGHDAGSGEINIFIFTPSPVRDFSFIQEALASAGLMAPARAAFREVGRENYNVIWPAGETSFSVI